MCLEEGTEEWAEFEAEEGSDEVEPMAENTFERGGTGESVILSLDRLDVEGRKLSCDR